MKIVGITSCPAGVAHTYMVAEALQEKCKSLNYECKIETQGASGPQNVLTEEDISSADYVILALGKALPDDQKKRFDNKKVIFVKISEALKDIDSIVNNLEEKAVLQVSESNKKDDNAKDSNGGSSDNLLNIDSMSKVGVLQHLMAGISAALPFIIGGGLLIAIAAIMERCGLQKTPFDLDAGVAPSLSWVLDQIGTLGFTIMVPVMGAYIASSIGGKPAFAPAFVCSFLANSPELLGTKSSAGFLGAVILGLAIGYSVRLLLKIKLGKYLQPLQGFFFIPLITFFVFGLITFFIIGPFVSIIMNAMLDFLNSLPKEYMMGMGALLGVMHCSDLGGPINKAAWFFEVGMVSSGVYTWYAVLGVTQMLPPMAAAIACWIAPKLFTEQERGNSISSFIIGATVATEPAIPYALAAPLPMFAANMLSGGITGALVMLFGLERMAPAITVIEPLLGLTTPAWAFYLCAAIGLALNTFFIILFKGMWLKSKNKKNANIKK